jgi:hypothetical protein
MKIELRIAGMAENYQVAGGLQHVTKESAIPS